MGNIKLIWDFRGPNGKKTAIHHEKHIRAFFKIEKKTLISSGIETLNEFHHLAFAVVLKADLEQIKSVLKPNRGQIVK
jgi:hypothetical protein